MDFPFARYHLPVISSISPDAAGTRFISDAGAASSGAIGTNNFAIYVPLVLAAPYLVNRLWWANGTTAAGNIDCGVYTVDGARILNTTPTVAQTTASVIQSVVPQQGATLLTPGSYYMAIAASLTTATFMRVQPTIVGAQLAGLAQQATAFPLPATFTLASRAGQLTPIFGIASATVI